MNTRQIALTSLILGLAGTVSGCVVSTTRETTHDVPVHEGYYDQEHHRYWHDDAWHDCTDHDDYCH